MEIKANREELLTCLDNVRDAATTGTNINQIFGNVLIRSRENSLTMITTNHEIQMEAECRLVSGKKLERILPVEKLQSILRALKDETAVTIKFRQDEAVIASGRTRYKLMTHKTEDFSPLGETSEMLELKTLPTADFRKALKKVVYASAQKSHRMSLNGVLLECTADGFTLTATDGHRLATQFTASGSKQKDEIQHILPRKTVDILIQRLADEETMKISANDRAIRFKTETLELISNVIQENYPDYKTVIPRDNDKKAIIGHKEFSAVMRHVAAVAEQSSVVTMKFSENQLEVECLNRDSDSLNDSLDINYSNEKIDIRFNINFIQDVLNAMSSDIIEMRMRDGKSSVSIKAAEDESFNYVLMPVNT